MRITVEIHGLRELERKLAAFPQEYRRGVHQAMEASVLHLQDRMAEYPPRQHGRKHIFRTAKERRWFFWALKRGLIRVPYRRTGNLGRTWTTLVQDMGGAVTGRVGNRTRYAKWVQGAKGEQAQEMSARNWQRIDSVLRRERRTIERFFREALDGMVRRLGGR